MYFANSLFAISKSNQVLSECAKNVGPIKYIMAKRE